MTIETSKPTPGRKLLKGGMAIADAICGEEPDPEKREKNRRWLYGQIPKLPVWSLEPNGELFAWDDELFARLEERAAEAEAERIAIAEAKAARKDEIAKDAATAASPKRLRAHKPRPRPVERGMRRARVAPKLKPARRSCSRNE